MLLKALFFSQIFISVCRKRKKSACSGHEFRSVKIQIDVVQTSQDLASIFGVVELYVEKRRTESNL
jgi:hypothetical protein